MAITKAQIDLPRQWEGKLAYVLHNVLSSKQCEELIKRAEKIGFDQPEKESLENKSDGFWNCSRCMLISKDATDKVWRRIRGLIPESWNNRRVIGLNERLRFFRYDPGESFHPHLDGSNCSDNGDRSFFSVQIFLNEDFYGGETTFLCMLEEDRKEILPKTGSVLIFEHDILHEDSPVMSGRKYVLQTDVMYSCDLIPKKSKLSRFLKHFRF